MFSTSMGLLNAHYELKTSHSHLLQKCRYVNTSKGPSEMNTYPQKRKIRLSEPRTSWEHQGVCEVAAGKLEVMEKFFTPLPHSAIHRTHKGERNQGSSWDRTQEPFYSESLSSSSPSSSTSSWSSGSNFGGRKGFSGYHSRAHHSRSCNDLTAAKGRKNAETDKRRIQKGNLVQRRLVRDSSDRLSTGNCSVGSNNLKVPSGHGMDTGFPEDKRKHKTNLKNAGRKARSMEALAERQPKGGQRKGQKKVLEEKVKFSQFLNEITVQVLSPSRLNSLGVKGQATGSQKLLKNSSTDSSGSRGKSSQHLSATEQQELRKKGNDKLEAPVKLVGDRSKPRRSGNRSTSPDSASSLVWQKESVQNTGATSLNLAPKSPDIHFQHKGNQIKEKFKGASRFLQAAKEKKEDFKPKTQGKVLSGDLSPNSTMATPLIPPPDWWRDRGDSIASKTTDKNQENTKDKSRRSKDQTSRQQPSGSLEESHLHTSDSEKDSLNQKITELLEHLVRAQSTICALEKLNVSTLLGHLPADVLETVNLSHLSPDASNKMATSQDLITTTKISSETSRQDTPKSHFQNTTEMETVKIPTEPCQTAFSPWSPRSQKSLPTLHTLNSTESDCSLEENLPTCKLLSPRFPNLGESFSDDRKDEGSSNECETRTDNTIPRMKRFSQSQANLLPANYSHKSCSRASSTESSGDEAAISWGQMLPQGSTFDYQSAQKILDTLLGLTSPTNRFSTPPPKYMDGFSTAVVTHIDEKHQGIYRKNSHEKDKEPSPRSNSTHFPHAVKLSRKSCHNISPPSSSPSSLQYSKVDPTQGSYLSDSKVPPIPPRRSQLPRGSANRFSSPATVDELSFSSLGTQEDSGSGHDNSEYLHTPLSDFAPGNNSENHNRNSMTEYPTGKHWESQSKSQNYWLEGSAERKPRKEKTVHFHTLNSDDYNGRSQLTIKSKFMATKSGDQGLDDCASLDSNLL